MAIVRIKRSSTAGNPSTLAQGELAYSSLDGAGGNRLYIGTGTETAGDAANHEVIGGVYFTSMLDHAAGTLTASSAIIVDANSKIDNLKVDNLDLNGNTISTTNTDGNLVLNPNGTGAVRISDAYNLPTADGSADEFLKTDGSGNVSFAAVPSGSFTLSDGSDTDTFTTGQTLTFDGGTGITTSVTDNQVSFAITNSGVTADTYGSATAIPSITVNAQGQITSATTNSVASDLAVQVGTKVESIPLLTERLVFDAGEGLDVAYDSGTNTVSFSGEDATTSNKGIASFSSNDFGVSSGAVTIKDLGVSNAQLAGSIANSKLANSAVTVTAGDGLGGGGSVSLGSSVSLNVNVDDSTIETNSDTLRIKDAGVTNAKLANDSITIGSTEIDLGATSTTLAGLTQLDVDNVRIDGNTISTTDAGDSTLYLNPGPVGDSGTVIVQGDLTVRGTTTTINSTEVTINDLTLVLADSADNAAAADGAGLIVGSSSYSGGTKPTFLYEASGDKWVSNKDIDATIVGMSETIDDRVSNLLLAGEGIDLTYDDAAGSLTVTAETATASNLGVASFPTAQFTLSSGAVTISVIDGGTYS